MSQPRLTFRWSKHVRRWAAFGPASALVVGSVVEVTRGDETVVLKRITSVSKPFRAEVNGIELEAALGYVSDATVCPVCREAPVDKGSETSTCGLCAATEMGLLG